MVGVNSKSGKRKEPARRERKSIVIFWCSAPLTSPVSPIVLHHNGGCLIILLTADYQSSCFQGLTSKRTQQYRAEREFFWKVWPPADYKERSFKDTPVSIYTYPPNTEEMRCCRGQGLWVAGSSWNGMHTEHMAVSWKEKWFTCWSSFSTRMCQLVFSQVLASASGQRRSYFEWKHVYNIYLCVYSFFFNLNFICIWNCTFPSLDFTSFTT